MITVENFGGDNFCHPITFVGKVIIAQGVVVTGKYHAWSIENRVSYSKILFFRFINRIFREDYERLHKYGEPVIDLAIACNGEMLEELVESEYRAVVHEATAQVNRKNGFIVL